MARQNLKFTLRGLALAVALVALPIAHQEAPTNPSPVPYLGISEACAQTSGGCVTEPLSFCEGNGEYGYNQYELW